MRKIRNKEGAMSLWMVIVLLVAVVVFTGLVEIMQRSFALQEINSVMDTAGVTALSKNVKEEEIEKWERYYRTGNYKPDINDLVSKEGTKHLYKKIVEDDTAHITFIRDTDDAKLTVSSYEDTHGLGTSTLPRPQVEIDSVMIVTVDAHGLFDKIANLNKWYYESRSSENFMISYIGENEDGEVELSIRSVTRIIYNREFSEG
ncbi:MULTISPECIES: hypothetical protein [unclassified Psychrobacillus]|uniref:hypothetical protein n=1 Tax=unclassified Psychrobacillus TaxID=2636677 RepID=UPI0030FBF531